MLVVGVQHVREKMRRIGEGRGSWTGSAANFSRPWLGHGKKIQVNMVLSGELDELVESCKSKRLIGQCDAWRLLHAVEPTTYLVHIPLVPRHLQALAKMQTLKRNRAYCVSKWGSEEDCLHLVGIW